MDAFSDPAAGSHVPQSLVGRSIQVLRNLDEEYKKILCAIQISIWLGLASTGKSGLKHGKLKLSIVSFALQAAIGYNGTGKPDKTRLKLAKQCAETIQDATWEPLCEPSPLEPLLAPRDPLSMISFTCMRLVLKLLSSKKKLVMTGLRDRIKKDRLYAMMNSFVKTSSANPHVPDRGYGTWTPNVGPLDMTTLNHRVMRRPYEVFNVVDFRNKLGIFSILPIGAFDKVFLGNVMATEREWRRTEQTHAAPNVDASGFTSDKEDEEEEEEEDKEEEEEPLANKIDPMFPNGLSAKQLHDVHLIVRLRETLKAMPDHLKCMALIQRNFAQAVAATASPKQASTWATYDFFYKTLPGQNCSPKLVAETSNTMAPYWNGIFLLDRLNGTNRWLFNVLKVALTPKDKLKTSLQKAAVAHFQSMWQLECDNGKNTTDWSYYKDWNRADLAGIGLLYL